MKWRKLAAFLAVAVLGTGMITGCSKSSESTDGSAGQTSQQTEGTSDKEDITVAGIVFQEDQFMQMMSAGYKAAAEDAGVELMTANTGNDISKETELINTYLSQGIDGVAIAPLDATTSIESLKRADEKGMKVGICNMATKDASFIVGGYTSDDYNLGETSAKAAIDYINNELGGKAKIAIVQLKAQLPEISMNRSNGFIETVQEACPDVEIVADQDAWLQDKAVQVVGDILTANPDVDIIWAANEGGTVGSVMAVKNAGKGDTVKVFGTDASDQTISMLKSDDNILQAVAAQDPYAQGYNAMTTVIKACQGEDISDTKGKCEIVEGILLSRTDMEGIEKYEADVAEKLGK